MKKATYGLLILSVLLPLLTFAQGGAVDPSNPASPGSADGTTPTDPAPTPTPISTGASSTPKPTPTPTPVIVTTPNPELSPITVVPIETNTPDASKTSSSILIAAGAALLGMGVFFGLNLRKKKSKDNKDEHKCANWKKLMEQKLHEITDLEGQLTDFAKDKAKEGIKEQLDHKTKQVVNMIETTNKEYARFKELYEKCITDLGGKNKIKAVIFDLNGIFLQAPKLGERLAREYGVNHEEFMPRLHEIMHAIRQPDAKPAWEYWRKYLEEWKLDFTEESFWAYWFGEEKVSEQMVNFAKELRVKGIKVFILSNNFKERTEYYGHYPWIHEAVDKVYFSWQTGLVKPDVKAWELVLKENKLEPKDCIYFDDQEKNLEAAEGMGIKSHKFTTEEELEKVIRALI